MADITFQDAIAWIRTRDISSDEYHKAVKFIVDLHNAQQQQITQGAVIRQQYERHIINNCKFIKRCLADGLGYPETVEGICGGYAQGNSDEPHDICKECIAAYNPDADYDATPDTAILILEAIRAADEYDRSNNSLSGFNLLAFRESLNKLRDAGVL